MDITSSASAPSTSHRPNSGSRDPVLACRYVTRPIASGAVELCERESNANPHYYGSLSSAGVIDPRESRPFTLHTTTTGDYTTSLCPLPFTVACYYLNLIHFSAWILSRKRRATTNHHIPILIILHIPTVCPCPCSFTCTSMSIHPSTRPPTDLPKTTPLHSPPSTLLHSPSSSSDHSLSFLSPSPLATIHR